jgi:hypothetical protein
LNMMPENSRLAFSQTTSIFFGNSSIDNISS